jgi:uncharacterized membrane protein YfcA
MPFSLLELTLAFVIVCFSAVVQGSVGMGFNIVSVPLTLLIDPRMAPVPMLFVAIVLTSFTVLREPGHVDLHGTWWILGGRIPGVLVGLGLLAVTTTRTLDVIIGGSVLTGVLLMAFAPPLVRTRAVDFGAGIVSGTLSTVSAIGGPPVGLLYKDEAGPTIRATLGAIFTIGATITLVGRGLAGRIVATDLQLALVYLPAVLIGFSISTHVNRKLEGARFRTPILVLSALASAALLLRSAF